MVLGYEKTNVSRIGGSESGERGEIDRAEDGGRQGDVADERDQARDPVAGGGVAGESRGEREREFESIYRWYRESLEPVGPLEEMLVERIVTTYWRLHRVLIAERGEITKSMDTAQQAGDMLDPDRFLPAIVSQDVETTGPGLFFLVHILREARKGVEQTGELTAAAVQRVANVYRGKPSPVTERLQKFHATMDENPEGRSAEESRAEWRQRVLAFLDGELNYFGNRLVLKEGREKRDAQTSEEASHLPSRSKLDKIQRYEASLERQLYRAMNQLERLQRVRRGERIPPPWVVSQ
jgi:hypothetical protein